MTTPREPLLSLPAPGAVRPATGARSVLLASLAVTLVLYALPFGRLLARPLILLSTLAHEMGHGVTAVLLGGGFERFLMWANGSGVAEIDLTGFGRIRQGLALAGGLVGPAVAAAVLFTLGRTGRGARAGLMGLGVLLLLAEVLVVRNFFGFFFVGLVAAGCLLASRLKPETARWVVVFVGVQLALAVFSRADYLFISVAHTSAGIFPSDVSRMEAALFLPYWFWGAVCGAFAVAVLIYGIRTCWSR
ncbi:MAG TPA: M50 family metallopeptidase [Thermoanaerobaculia bacterium]|nr:M50 family metallopeptidase [Thermoanaerobaculia bacterium]